MPTYQQYEQQFAQDLIDAPGSKSGALTATAMSPGLQALIDAFPYFGDTDFESIHRGAMANLLEVFMPNNGIAPQGNDSGFGYMTYYYYNGSYSGYQNAFFNGVSQTSAAANLAQQVAAVNGNLNNGWWGNYGVTVLTDAVRRTVGGSLDTGKLATDLANNNSALLPALAASYYAVYCNGFGPTANALNALISSGQAAAANTELVASITSGEFTANINEAIAMGGDSTNAAVWFLFNLWITLKALGNSNVDVAIVQFQSAGLTVPAEVGSGSWWTGGYTSWFQPLSGSDVLGVAGGTINAGFPEKEVTYFASFGPPAPPPPPVTSYPSPANGYCWSLINWGSLNWYNPPPSSCFGKGTEVLMADGSVKPIEEIQVGDEVQSEGGSRKVLLVESPKRAGRTLYRINGLNAYATVGHPFRMSGNGTARRCAIDPWALIDSVPTMTEEGVATLRPGAILSAMKDGSSIEVTVERIDGLEADPSVEETIYDLIVEREGSGVSPYYVGGPDLFLMVDSETADPLYDPAATVAIVTAMQTAIESCRKNVADPISHLPGVISQVQFAEVLPKAKARAFAVQEGKLERPSVPGLEFFFHEGKWDAHASMLEAYLVRQYARTLRREAAMGWRSLAGPPEVGDRLAVTLYDVQMLGDIHVGAEAKLNVRLSLRGWGTEDVVKEWEVQVGAKPAWHISIDQIVDFGRVPASAGMATLIGEVTLDETLLGHFHLTAEDATLGRTAEPFLFDPSGNVIGRVGIEPRRGSGQDRILENHRANTWSTQQSHTLAMNVGQQIGQQIVGLLEHKNG